MQRLRIKLASIELGSSCSTVVAVRCHIARSHGCKLEYSRVKRRRKTRTRQLSSAVFNLTRARFPKWKELKSSKTFWLLVFLSTRSTIYAGFLKLEGSIWPRVQACLNLPHRPCHGKEGAPCRFADCPARCARCKYHARALLLRHLRWFYPLRRSYRHHRSLCQRTVGDYSTSFKDRHCCQVRCRHSAIAGINGKPVHGSPASRKASIGHDHRWCSNKQSSSPQPGSVYAADDQMDKGCCVPPKKPPFLAVHNTPLLDRITSAFRTRMIKDICADQDVCRMFKQSKKL